ncbi:MAG: AAA family ATPase, partial [Myxococcales bacterium]|nr:AAA family ATPase [Myxococcales bacterium]
ERLVDPGAPLRRCGAVTLGEPAREGSSARAELVVAAGVTRWLSGGPALAPALGSCVELGAPADVEEIHAAAVARLIDALRGEGRPAFVDLVGPDGVGRRRVALAIAAQLARPCLVVDGAVAARLEAADFTALVEGLTLASRLDRAAICWRAPEALVAAERPDRLAQLARADFDVFFWTWSKMPPVGAWPAALRGRLRAELTPPTEERRVALWSATLPEADAAAIAAVAGAFRMTGGQIREAGAAARALAVGRGVTPTSALLLEVGRQHVAPRLGALASLVVRTSSWDDLVLPPARRQQLEELVRRHRHRATVLSAWGFGRRHADARGLAALFSGASGTGKTMAAAIVARELGRDLYRVDLSQIVSKYIGETEK